MAGNKKIFDLPLRTGVTADDRLAIVDSGNTTTYSVKLSDLQDGTGVNTLESLTGNITFSGTNIDISTDGQTIVLSGSTGGGGGGELKTSNGTDSFRSSNYLTTDTAGDGQIIIGGTGNTITSTAGFNSSVGGEDNTLGGSGSWAFQGGGGLNTFTQNGWGDVMIGGYGNVCSNSGFGGGVMIGGRSNTGNNIKEGSVFLGGTFADMTGDKSVVIGGFNASNTGSQGFIIGGTGNSSAATYNGVLGGSDNNASSSRSGVVFGSNNTTGEDAYTFASFSFSNTSANNPSKPTISIGGKNNKSSLNNNGYCTFLNGLGNKIYATGGSGHHNIYGGTSNWISASGTYASPVGTSFTGDTNTILNSKNSNIQNGVLNTIIGSDACVTSATTRTTIIGLSGYTATADDMVYVPALNVVNYASLNFADDTAAAAGGVELGGLYHNAGAVRIRIT